MCCSRCCHFSYDRRVPRHCTKRNSQNSECNGRAVSDSNRYCMCIGTDSFTGLGKRKKPRRQLQTSVTPVIKEGSTTVAKVGKDMIDLLLVQTLSSTTSVNLAISMAVRRFGTLILTCKMSSETEPSIEACCLFSSQG